MKPSLEFIASQKQEKLTFIADLFNLLQIRLSRTLCDRGAAQEQVKRAPLKHSLRQARGERAGQVHATQDSSAPKAESRSVNVVLLRIYHAAVWKRLGRSTGSEILLTSAKKRYQRRPGNIALTFGRELERKASPSIRLL